MVPMKSVKALIEEANTRIKSIAVEEAVSLLDDSETAFVDLRESAELHREGMIPSAVHVSRGMLEFAVDPTSPYHNPVFSSGRKLVLYCASGGRSALAADTAQRMGVSKVAHLEGGFKGWKAAGGRVETL
jgi:rhodanese-related sulfurtransferase